MASIHDPDLDVRIKKGTERISENMHIIANEPSLAFYRLQEHVRKAMPAMVQKKVEVTGLHQDLQGCCYDVEYALSAIKSTEKAEKNFNNIQELLKNAVFLRQQLKYEECRRSKKDPQFTFKRLSAHITLDLPDIPDALRETASRVESIMTQGLYKNQVMVPIIIGALGVTPNTLSSCLKELPDEVNSIVFHIVFLAMARILRRMMKGITSELILELRKQHFKEKQRKWYDQFLPNKPNFSGQKKSSVYISPVATWLFNP